MEDRKKAKKILLFGAIIGGLVSLAITILMDTLFAGAAQGTWRDAIAKDLNTLLSLGLSSSSFIVNMVFALVLALMTAFGSFMGFIFSFFVYKFLQLLTNK
jgi:pheromone shutdown protein TraB